MHSFTTTKKFLEYKDEKILSNLNNQQNLVILCNDEKKPVAIF